MDLHNYPLNLFSAELEHELNIRGLFNISNNRIKTASLRDLMLKESLGIELPLTKYDGKCSDRIK